MMPGITIGKYSGTGSTVAIELGFMPDAVLIFNQSDGRPWLSYRGDTSDTAYSLDSTGTQLTSGGVVYRNGTFGDNASTVGMGFEVSGSSLSISGKVYKYIAFRSGAGQQNKLAN